MFIEFELFSIEESCLLNFACHEFCSFVNFVEFFLEKTCFQKKKNLKEKKKEISSIPSLLLISLLFSN
jgi:hypothetical protein